MILGDSLLVMTSLAEKEGLKGKVQTIYFDPPYGIEFRSNWQVSTRKRDVKDGKAEDATRQPEQIRAFRDTWRLRIHSYLAYLRDRLVVARELLTETGSVFVQIGDENVHLVRCILDEVFGAENYLAVIAFKKPGQRSSDTLPILTDFLLWYAKDRKLVKYRQLLVPKSLSGAGGDHYSQVELADGSVRPISADERLTPSTLPPGAKVFETTSATSAGAQSSEGTIQFEGRSYRPPPHKHWSASVEGMHRLALAGRLVATGDTLRYKRYFDDFPCMLRDNRWDDAGLFGESIYAVQTSTTAVQNCILMTTDPGDLVLDPTCGSGTAAYVAEQWGRRWITIDTSRVALALARTRLMAARYPYYLLLDSAEGLRKEAEITGRIPPDHRTDADIRRGFVYRRVSHITLKSIANNAEIKDGVNRAGVDAAVMVRAETELLYDLPYEDSKRIRVSGPFTVESLSPHRVLATDEERPVSETRTCEGTGGPPFETTILENLKRAGVQNTFKNERLVFERIEPFAGTWIHAQGFYTDKLGSSKRVAISIGPEHGTVGPEQLKEAAKESIKGVGFDTLIVCGFAFDPHVYETAKQIEPDARAGDALKAAEPGAQYGRLPVLLTRMNPDLLNDDLLKKTGAGNLFMVFGEPEIKLDPEKDGKWTVTLKGLDVYDPTTGAVRNSSTDDIACWFIDTDYNGESFFVRHAYFTGAGEPYEKLQRALRAEIDEAAWATLYSTKSRPFDPPKSGKIAIKVINHYGDEVLKVVDLTTGRRAP
jgi:adenine-specific DNA-methyltransferase